MNLQRSATLPAVFYPAIVMAGWAFVSLAGVGSPRLDRSGVAQAVDLVAPSLMASVELAAAPQTTAIGYAPARNTDATSAAEFLAQPVAEPVMASKEPPPVTVAALTDPAEVLVQEIPAAQAANAGTADVQPQQAATATDRIELVGECQVADACIDQFL